jgi:hypothetical protein
MYKLCKDCFLPLNQLDSMKLALVFNGFRNPEKPFMEVFLINPRNHSSIFFCITAACENGTTGIWDV